MSSGELEAAAHDSVRYDIMRVYELNHEGARLRIATNVGPFAKGVIGGLSLPAGVEPDSYSIAPSFLTWGSEEIFQRPKGAE